jgi:hypothetical protein
MKRAFKKITLLLGLLPAIFPLAGMAATEHKQFLDIKMTPPLSKPVEPNIRPDALDAANTLKIAPYIVRLQATQTEFANGSATRAQLNARLLCLWKIAQAAMEVRKLTAAIDRDLASSNIALDTLMARKETAQNFINTMNFMQGGTLGIIKQSLFLHRQFQASQYPLITSFSVGTGLAALNLVLPSVWIRRIDEPPNTLSHFLRKNYEPADRRESYLWSYLDAPIPNSEWPTMSRREVLIHHWEDFEGLDQKQEKVLRKLSALPEGSENLHESISLVNQRISLLHDLKTHVEEFDGALYELHKSIAAN